MASRLELPKFQAFDSSGDPLTGGLLYTYTIGTTTPKATYTDAEAGTPQANPIVLNSRGEADSDIYGIGYYKMVLKTSTGVEIYTIDSIAGVNESTMTTIGDYSGDFDAAITAIAATETTLYVDSAATMSAVVTVPSTCAVIIQKGGSIDQAGNALTFNGPLIMQGGTITNDAALAINGPFEAGLYKVFSDTGAVTFTKNIDEIYPQWWGASPSASAAVNDAACTYAVASVGSTGIPIHIPAGTYAKTTAITSTSSNFNLKGDGKYSSILSITGAVDGIVLGQDDANTTNCQVSNLGVVGGRYGLRLNNVQTSKFSNLFLSTQTTSIYLEGQIETSTFRDIYLSGFSTYGVSTGNLNGGANASYNFPMFQKCEWDHIETRGASGSTAFKLDAEIYLAVQAVSGFSTFRHIVSQGLEVTVIDAEYLYNTTFDHITNETTTLPAANTYSIIKVGTGCGVINITSSYLSGQANDATTYKYCVEINAGLVTIQDYFTATGSPGTSEIYMAGSGLMVSNSTLQGGSTSGITFSNNITRSKTLLVNVRDVLNVPITDWAVTTPWIATVPIDAGGQITIGLATGNLLSMGYLGQAQSNGQSAGIKSLTELTTIAAAATTDTTIKIPANVIVIGVSVRVTTIIPTAATFTVIGASSSTAFQTGTNVAVAANTTDKGNKNCPYLNATAQSIRITPNTSPAAATGKVRVTIHYLDITVPIS